MNYILKARCKLCGEEVSQTLEARDDEHAEYRLMQKSRLQFVHDCGHGRKGILDVKGIVPEGLSVSQEHYVTPIIRKV